MRELFSAALRRRIDAIRCTDLFDSKAYSDAYLRRSLFANRPEAHYALIGERLGYRPNPFFDPRHYRKALGLAGCRPRGSLLVWYARHGALRCETPSREFEHTWYSWQNRDWLDHGAAPHPLRHFLQVGLQERRDPSPRIDLRRFLDALAPKDCSEITTLLTRQLRDFGKLLGAGITEDFAELRIRQERFRATLNFDILRQSTRRHADLVYLQSGRDAQPRYLVGTRAFDVLRNYYQDPGDAVCQDSDHVVFQRGSKVSGIAAMLRNKPDLLEYDFILFLDDDIDMTAVDIERFFAAMRSSGAALAQPLLTKDSPCVWPVFRDPELAGKRSPVSSVEVMMPGFSRDALTRLAWTFSETVSGFGVDLLWGHTLDQDRDAGRILLIGDVLAQHMKPIDDVGGAFYRFMAEHNINPKYELWMMMQRHGLVADFRLQTPR